MSLHSIYISLPFISLFASIHHRSGEILPPYDSHKRDTNVRWDEMRREKLLFFDLWKSLFLHSYSSLSLGGKHQIGSLFLISSHKAVTHTEHWREMINFSYCNSHSRYIYIFYDYRLSASPIQKRFQYICWVTRNRKRTSQKRESTEEKKTIKFYLCNGRWGAIRDSIFYDF